jgi:hypothetical protein
MFEFDLKGYKDVGSAGTKVTGYNDASQLMADWYNYARQMGKASLKYKQTPTSLTDTAMFAEYWRLYVFVVANLVALLSMEKLYQYSQALTTLEMYLGSKFGRLRRLYRRVSAIFSPELLKMYSTKIGTPCVVPGLFPIHFRLWSENKLTVYGGPADYTDLVAETPDTILLDNTKLDNFINNIEKALWALENYITYSATVRDDFIAIKDAIDMLNDVLIMDGKKPVFVQGLPAPEALPGISMDKAGFNDWYTRGLLTYDTKGVGGDEVQAFPVPEMIGFVTKIPVKGWGGAEPAPLDYTLFGAPKFFVLGDTNGLRYQASTAAIRQFGTDTPVASGYRKVKSFTMEDSWTLEDDASVDFGDGASIRTFMNGAHPTLRHIWLPHQFASQLTSTMEFKFVDQAQVDYTVYVPPEDLVEGHAVLLGQMFGVPYLKRT